MSPVRMNAEFTVSVGSWPSDLTLSVTACAAHEPERLVILAQRRSLLLRNRYVTSARHTP